jgi:LytR cell envelope-related transcriptional attenuator
LAELVREIGAAGGLASVVGLAVLAALYFSQARDVKRLREWAGRAPDRSRAGVTAVPARAAGVPPPAQPQTAAIGGSAPAVQLHAKPSPQAPITRPAALRAVPQQPVTTPSRRSQTWYGRIGIRYVAVALVALLVLGGAAAYGVTRLSGDDGGGNSANAQTNAKGSPGKRKRDRAAVNPGNVTVAVLNGTTVPGLAATLRDQIAAAGFRKGTIDVFSDQQLAGSVVQYAPGHRADAQAVGRKLGISQSEPVTAESRALAGDATVIVIAGADKAP